MVALPAWMRRALFATAVMNIVASAAFVPAAVSLRTWVGLPEAGHPLYLVTVGMFVLLFGVGYLASAARGRADRMFIALAAVGKLSFFGLLVWFWIVGSVPLRAPMTATGDLIFGVMFLVWLFRVRA